MLLIPMDSKDSIPCIVSCIECGKRRHSSRMHADIEGEPYKAFYCPACIPSNATVMTREQFFAMKEGSK